MRYLAALAALGPFVVACAMVDAPVAGRQADRISVDRVRDHVFYLASDELEGRATGEPGFEAAARYVEAELTAYGAAPLFSTQTNPMSSIATSPAGDEPGRDSYRQDVYVRQVTVNREGALLIHRGEETTRVPLLDGFQVVEASPEASWKGRKRVAYAGLVVHEPDYGWDDLADLQLEDRCLFGIFGTPRSMAGELPEEVWQHYWPWETGIWRKGRSLRGRGVACALIMPSPEPIAGWEGMLRNPSALVSTQLVGAADLDDGEPQPVVAMLSRQVAEQLFEGQPYAAMPGGRPRPFELEGLEIELDLEVSASEPLPAANVGALLPGTDASLADQAILLNAHLDGQGNPNGTILNSANDNASSVAALLEATRVLAAGPVRRPVIVLFPAAEELGLAGSRHFADNPPIPFEHIGLMINMEMVGKRARGLGDYSFRVTGRLSEEVETLARQAEQSHGGVVFDYELVYDEPGEVFRQSDHVHFFLREVPTIYFHAGRGTGVDYHQPTDDPDRVDIGKVATMAEVLVEMVRATDTWEHLPRVNRPRARNIPHR